MVPESRSNSANNGKAVAAKAAVDLVEDGMVVGLGTGSTALIALEMLGERVARGLRIHGVATSEAIARKAAEIGIKLISLSDEPHPDIDIDGADEVEPGLCLIKGGGGALFREKVVAYASRRVVIIVDESKLVERLGSFHVPVEVAPFALGLVASEVEAMGGRSALRKNKDGTQFRTDQDNLIIDCDFGLIESPRKLADMLSAVPGIIEHGLFVDLADEVIISDGDEIGILRRSPSS